MPQISGLVGIALIDEVDSGAGGSFRICSTANCSSVVTTWTSAATTVENGQYVQLRVPSSTDIGGAITYGVVIGGVQADWLVTSTSSYKLVFVTNGTAAGNFGGIAYADGVCTSEASAAGLTGTFLAWLATDGNDPLSRFTQATVPYRRTDLALVSPDWTELTSGGGIENPITRNAAGSSVGSNTTVWANTHNAGDIYDIATDCTDWTSTAGTNGRIGDITENSWKWINDSTAACSTQRRFYCFQQ